LNFSIIAIFGAGLLTFASPCVLPLMPIYLATIAGSSLEHAQPRRTLVVAAAFSLGLASVFVLLGALASSVGGLLVAHRTAITLVSGLLMAVFGLRGLGLLRSRALERDARPALTRIRTASSLSGAFLFGAAFALGWSPCIGPVLASVLSYAAAHAGSPLHGAVYLAVYAAGLALPLLLLAGVAARATSWIKRARGLVPVLEKLTGAALLAIGLWTLGGALDMSSPFAEAPPSAAACDIDHSAGHTCALPGAPRVAGTAAAAVVHVEGAQMLEFTSQECPVCRRMRPVVDKLVTACSELGTRTVRIDVTTASGRALAEQHGVRGTPTFVLVDEDGVEKARLLGENTAEDVAAAVERAFGISCWG
jgi:cytochrome c-type biogenesis protein